MSSPWAQLFDSLPQAAASRSYCIAFTPRSGSSWLENLLTRSGILGKPGEWLNPGAARNTAVRSGTDNLTDYYAYLKKVMRTEDVFGIEMTWPHINLALQSAHPGLFDDIRTWFFLRRRDFVAQGVSLFKAQQSGVFHSVQADRKGKPVEYDEEEIRGCVQRIMTNEFALNQFFAQRGLQPTPLWYEELVTSSAEEVVRLFGEALELAPQTYQSVPFKALKSQHTKIGDGQSESMIQQFKAENTGYVQYWEQHRGKKSHNQFLQDLPDLPS
jgi:trehalose 2-sulfotransferase